MEYRPLKINVISADGIKDVKLFSKMDVYAQVSIAGYPQSMKKTFVDKNSGTTPKWNHRMEFIVDEPYLTKPGLSLLFQLKAESTFGSDKEIGSATIPIHDLFNPDSTTQEDRQVEYQLHTPSGKSKGSLKFSYQFGEKFKQEVEAKRHVDDPVTAYPAAPYAAAPPPGYPNPPHPVGYGAYPQSSGYGYQAPPPAGYGYQAPPPGYGYQPPPPGYGYQGGQPPKKNKMGMGGGLGLGLGAGLLGGLLVGEMASDIGESAAYADGYGDAMGDMGGDW
ncbi:hypothetical protein MIMGU_mgv1a011603mg [Erythranthe guttata]|uniref:C2 domain-containing protein n=1 Tax=Erythranthe guttata TaxID=4155 RepID=A0A022PXA2_ERYGU|nr:hypothetical protein MIMGU_mgv1a011603mg [Erythranthe guttata]